MDRSRDSEVTNSDGDQFHSKNDFSEPTFRADVPQVPCLCTKSSLQAFSAGSIGSTGNGSAAAVRNLPSSRAGGQDDVSSQANSLK